MIVRGSDNADWMNKYKETWKDLQPIVKAILEEQRKYFTGKEWEAEEDFIYIKQDREKQILSILQAQGATSLEIATKEYELMQQRNAGEHLLYEQKKKIYALTIQSIEAEKNKLTSLYIMYEEADEMEKARIRRMMELRGMTPHQLAVSYGLGGIDESIMRQYFNQFSEAQQQAVGEVIRRRYDLSRVEIPELEVTPQFGDININMPVEALENFSQKVGEMLTEQLMKDKRLQKLIAGLIREEV
jgi:hypothetical protein